MQHNLNNVRAATCLQRILAASLAMCMQQNPRISVSPTHCRNLRQICVVSKRPVVFMFRLSMLGSSNFLILPSLSSNCDDCYWCSYSDDCGDLFSVDELW